MTPKIGPRELVHENPFHRIYRVVAQFDGFQKEYFVNTYGARVGLVIADGNKILFVRQYRLLVHGLTWELPGGKVHENETPEAAARREALEEAGLECDALRPLIFAQPGVDTFENPTSVFYTESFEQISEVKTDPREVVERVWLPLPRALAMIFQREIVDSMTVVGLLAYDSLKKNRELAPR